jgi:ferric-dicitrate binding protein FerR (iron transport regulator)
MGVVRRRIVLPREACRAVARREASARLLLAVLLLIGALAAFPADAGDRSPAAPSMPIGLDVLDTSRPPVGANWVVLAAAEDASWRDQGGGRWHDFQQGQVLMPGSEIETGPGGEVILVVGGDQVRIAPSTRLVLPAVAADGQRLRHERGRLRVDVEPRPGRDFEVTTPLLSLGIKGTSFETAVDQEQDTVVVLDGEVEVRPIGREESFRLNEGQGLRQPAAPGAEPLPFELPAAAAGQTPGDPTSWHLQGESRADLRDGRAAETGDDAMTDRAGRSKDRGRPAAKNSASPSKWAADSASLLIVGALAAAVVLLLAAPVMALCHNIFERWLGRPATGRRRRELTLAV